MHDQSSTNLTRDADGWCLCASFINMINRSFAQCCFPSSQKEAIVGKMKEIITWSSQPEIVPTDIKHKFYVKTYWRIAVNRFNFPANLFQLLPVHQSAYQQSHSTETAVTVVHNDIVCATDAGQVFALVLLDLSAAFDTVDHNGCAFISFWSQWSCLWVVAFISLKNNNNAGILLLRHLTRMKANKSSTNCDRRSHYIKKVTGRRQA